MSPSPRSFRRLVLAALLVLGASPAWAQVGVPSRVPLQLQPRFGIGYVANVPNQFAGVTGHWISSRFGGLGVYLDAKFDLDSPEQKDWYVDSLTVADADERLGDRVFSRDGSWTSVNVALMRPLTPQFTLYGGLGYSEGKEYVEYHDPQLRIHETGFYWVRDEATSGTKLNLLGGAMMQLTRTVAVHFGAESQPAGFTVGMSYLIPR